MGISGLLSDIFKKIRIIKNKVLFLSVCREEYLPQKDIDLLAAVISCESAWDDKAVNINDNGTRDNGICQWNDYWAWKKEKIISPDEALNNPKKSMELMVKYFKKGELKRWACFSRGIYKKFV